MNALHERLKEERLRIGLSQDEFAENGGVKRRAQIHYESGERCPDGHYLSAIAAKGVDVQYVLTGVRAVRPELVEGLGNLPVHASTSSARTEGDSPQTEVDLKVVKMAELLDGLNTEQQKEILAVISEKKRLNSLENRLNELEHLKAG